MRSSILDRSFAAPILILNFALYAIVLGIAAWALKSMVDGISTYGNEVTPNFTLFTLVVGATGIASVFTGLRLMQSDWRVDLVVASMTSSLTAWIFLLIAFGLACKEIRIGHSGTTLNFLEAFVIVLTVTQGFYLLLLLLPLPPPTQRII